MKNLISKLELSCNTKLKYQDLELFLREQKIQKKIL